MKMRSCTHCYYSINTAKGKKKSVKNYSFRKIKFRIIGCFTGFFKKRYSRKRLTKPENCKLLTAKKWDMTDPLHAEIHFFRPVFIFSANLRRRRKGIFLPPGTTCAAKSGLQGLFDRKGARPLPENYKRFRSKRDAERQK